jgi:hypothetical protein
MENTGKSGFDIGILSDQVIKHYASVYKHMTFWVVNPVLVYVIKASNFGQDFREDATYFQVSQPPLGPRRRKNFEELIANSFKRNFPYP